MGPRDHEYQSIFHVQSQALHGLLMSSENLHDLRTQRHNPRLACLGARPEPLMRGSAIAAQRLTDQQLSCLKTGTFPGQPNQFRIPQSSAQPQGKAGVKALLMAPEVVKHLPNLLLNKHHFLH